MYPHNFKLDFDLKVNPEQTVEDIVRLVVAVDAELLRIRAFHAWIEEPGRWAELYGQAMAPFLNLPGGEQIWDRLISGEELEPAGVYTRLRRGHRLMDFETYREKFEAFLRDQLAMPEHAGRTPWEAWRFGMTLCGEVRVQAPTSRRVIRVLREMRGAEPDVEYGVVLAIGITYPCETRGCVRLGVNSGAHAWSEIEPMCDAEDGEYYPKSLARGPEILRNAQLLTASIRAVLEQCGMPLVRRRVAPSGAVDLLGKLTQTLAPGLDDLLADG